MVPSVCLSPLRGHVRQALSFTPTLISEKGTDSHTSSDLLKADLRECQCQGHTQGQALYTLQQSMASPAGHKDQSLPLHPKPDSQEVSMEGKPGTGQLADSSPERTPGVGEDHPMGHCSPGARKQRTLEGSKSEGRSTLEPPSHPDHRLPYLASAGPSAWTAWLPVSGAGSSVWRNPWSGPRQLRKESRSGAIRVSC